MARHNYVVFGDLGLSDEFMVGQLTVHDTEAAPTLIHVDLISLTLRVFMEYVPGLDIADANDNPLQTVGTIILKERLGTYFVHLDFVACKSLASPVILGRDFCDRFVDSIRLRIRTVELEDGSTILIVRKPPEGCCTKACSITHCSGQHKEGHRLHKAASSKRSRDSTGRPSVGYSYYQAARFAFVSTPFRTLRTAPTHPSEWNCLQGSE